MHRSRSAFLAAMVVAAALSRLIPHPPNATPIGALALFGGATFGSTAAAFLIPLGAMLLSDLILGLHPLLPAVYVAFALTVCLGLALRRRRRHRVVSIAVATLASALLFFLLTNAADWMRLSMYPKTWNGLLSCYAAALPFLENTLVGDALYAAALFGGLALAELALPGLRELRRERHASLLRECREGSAR